ncbi:MAG: hypothetical protein HYT46_03790 [Candidatus Vogelbacteria bacterium]|nr:hypothetical protein [Candidatus Vogelbacteria bacterium]
MNGEQGSATADLLWVLAIIAALWILWFATGGSARPEATAGPFIKPPPPVGSGEIYSASSRGTRAAQISSAAPAPGGEAAPINLSRSPWFGQVKIRAGNARYETRPNREYLELSANYQLEEPITVTGWFLSNGRNQLGGSSDFVYLAPAAKLFVDGAVAGPPIILESGGRVVVTTGGPPNTNLWPARVNFQINKCVGYLAEDVSQFRMTPSLPRACPLPRSEPGADRLDNDCYNYVNRLSACHTPEFRRDSEGYELLDGRRTNLSSQCRGYIQDHFNYRRCVAWHAADSDFYGKDWRIYLNHTGELWAANREVITLYDRNGKIVDQLAY